MSEQKPKVTLGEGVEAADGEMSADVAESLKGPKKIRISTMVDVEVLDALKAQAARDGLPYQTLLNMILKNAVLGPDEEAARKYDEYLERLLAEGIERDKRLKAIERKIKHMAEDWGPKPASAPARKRGTR